MKGRNVILLAFFMLCAHYAGAQVTEPVDTIQVADTLVDAVAPAPQVNRGFDARSYSMQKRFRQGDITVFSKMKFMSNTFFGLAYNYYLPLSINLSGSGAYLMPGPSFGVQAGKFFTPISGARFSLSGGWLHYDNPQWIATKLQHTELEASYMMNITSMLRGYDYTRYYEIIPFAGVGVGFNHFNNETPLFFDVNAGVNMMFRVGKNLSLFLEPKLMIMLHAISQNDASSDFSVYINNWRTASVYGNFALGVQYNILDDPRTSQLEYGKYWYAFASLGPQIHTSISRARDIGMRLMAGVARKYNDWLDLRLALSYGTNKNYGDGNMVISQYPALCLEAKIDFLAMALGSDTRYGLSLSLGPETGFFIKNLRLNEITSYTYSVVIEQLREQYPDKYRNFFRPMGLYMGGTLAIDGSYRIMDRLMMHVEPRLSLVPYQAAHKDLIMDIADYRMSNYMDFLVSLNLGVKYQF